MPQPIVLLGVLTLAGLSAGCAEPRIDLTTPESLRASILDVRASLDPKTREVFEAARTTVVADCLDIPTALHLALAGYSFETKPTVDRRRAALHGKSAAEVIAQAAAIREQRTESEIREIGGIALALRDLIDRLNDEKTRAEEVYSRIQQVSVSDTHVYWKAAEPPVYGQQLVLELSVHNGLNVTLDRVTVHGRIETPDRETPWVSEHVGHRIAGGLAPGETQRW